MIVILLHSVVLWPTFAKRVHCMTVVVYMNTFSYLVDDAKKARKWRKLNVANEKENSDASKPQEKSQVESKSSNSDSSKINIKAIRNLPYNYYRRTASRRHQQKSLMLMHTSPKMSNHYSRG